MDASTSTQTVGDIFAVDLNLSVYAHSGTAGDRNVNDVMEMTTFSASAPEGVEGSNTTDDKMYFGYYKEGSSTLHYNYEQFGSSDFWRVYKVHVQLNADSLSAANYTEAEAVAALAAKKTDAGYTLKVVAKQNNTGDDTRAVLHSATSSSGAPSEAYTLKELDLAASATALVEDGVDYYFGMYVEGTGTDGTTAPNASFTVVLTKATLS